MKRILLVFALVGITTSLFAQDSGRKGFIGISMGPSIPVGDFADKSFTSANAGFAKTGATFNLVNFGYKFGQNFGIVGSWFGSANNVDIQGVDGTWSYGGLMGGPMLSMPVSDRIDFDLKAMIGFASARLKIKDNGETSGTGAGFQFGGTLRYNFSEKWCMVINADYFASKQKFDKLDPSTDNFNQNIAAINLTFGVAYRLK